MNGGHFDRTLINNVDWVDGYDWVIREGYRFYLSADEGPRGEFVDVPERFRTNFASLPRITRPVSLPTAADIAQISGVHDKLFLAPVIRTAHSARPCRFEETPGIFLEGAEALGASWIKRRTIYRILQGFSRPAWDRYRAQDRLVGSTISLELATPATLIKFEALKCVLRMFSAT